MLLAALIGIFLFIPVMVSKHWFVVWSKQTTAITYFKELLLFLYIFFDYILKQQHYLQGFSLSALC